MRIPNSKKFIIFAKNRLMEKKYFIIINGQQSGPYDLYELKNAGLRPDSHVWREGLENWVPASSLPELSHLFAAPYAPGSQFDPYSRNIPHTNWMPWAIIATVFGFVCSCIGLIFGIIAIVKASNANRFYDMGNREMGDMYNSGAKTWTIVALVISGIGIICNIIYWAIFGSTIAAIYGL